MSEENQSPPPLPQQQQLNAPPSMNDDPAMRMLLPVGRSGWAIASGYFGLFSLIVIGAPFAIITGIIAVFDIKRSQKTDRPKHGMGRAVFGIVTGTVVLAALGVLIILNGQ